MSYERSVMRDTKAIAMGLPRVNAQSPEDSKSLVEQLREINEST